MLTPVEMQSENGSRLELQNDGSIFVFQPASKDTYTLVFQTDLKGIKGLRLEALADPRLPRGGPGWADNGNFVLNQLSLKTAPADGPGPPRPVALRNPRADFTEVGWDFPGVVAGILSSGWGILPEVNTHHTAVFETAEEAGNGQATRLTVRLNYQSIHDYHLLGRHFVFKSPRG